MISLHKSNIGKQHRPNSRSTASRIEFATGTRHNRSGERLSKLIATVREEADGLPDGPERDILLKKMEKAENASNMEAWANSTELQPP
ncbi:MAG: hypothetical protein K0Q64_2010, partial [Nitrobacter vulgaris]|nr:hypothetical protein [Nitrobacter vulgaris]